MENFGKIFHHLDKKISFWTKNEKFWKNNFGEQNPKNKASFLKGWIFLKVGPFLKRLPLKKGKIRRYFAHTIQCYPFFPTGF